jgi:predicted phage terminase large subunit-like protein
LVATILTNPWIPNDPHPKQAEFLTLVTNSGEVVYEAFYGGAAGGGKSEALLMAAAQYVEVPGYSAILFRKTFPDLAQPGAIMDRSKDWWGKSDAKWNEDRKEWRFPSGAVVKFGHMDSPAAIYNYYGAEYQFIGYDETTQFPLDLYTRMFARLRRKRGLNVPLRMRGASNPGGIGHEWVRQRFLFEGDENGRVFVPASISDNPSLDEHEYTRALNELDPVTRAQLLEGDWSVTGTGANFKRTWFEILDAMPVEFERLVRFWDTASTAPLPGGHTDPDYTVGVLMGRTPQQQYVILNVVRFRGTPSDVQVLIKNTADADAAAWEEAVEVFMEQEPGASGKMMVEHYMFHVLRGHYFQAIRTTGPKPVRAAAFSAMAQAKNVKIVRGPYLSAFFDELEAFPFGSHDDCVDAAAGAFNQLTSGGELRPVNARMRAIFRYQG